MKKMLLIAILFLAACENNDPPVPLLSKDQASLENILSRARIAKSVAPNAMMKDELDKLYLDTIRNYLKDSLNFRIKNARVKMSEVSLTPISNVKAFTANFEGPDETKYWTEMDFPDTATDATIYNNPAYKLLKNIPEKTDITLSFFWMGEVEWDDTYFNSLKIRVVPFPKDFNFDSSANANKPKIKTAKH